MPYTVILTHDDGEPTEHSFETMREAEAFIKRNTRLPTRGLPALYHQRPSHRPDRRLKARKLTLTVISFPGSRSSPSGCDISRRRMPLACWPMRCRPQA